MTVAAFRVRSFRYQWSADLLTSWAFEMETLVLGWYVMVNTGSVVWLTAFGSLQFLGTLAAPMFGVLGDRLGGRAMLCAMRAIYIATGRAGDDAGPGRSAEPGLGARRRRSGRHRAPQRSGDAQHAHRRDDPARAPDRRPRDVARHHGLRARGRRPGRRRPLHRARPRRHLRGRDHALRGESGADLRGVAAAADARPGGAAAERDAARPLARARPQGRPPPRRHHARAARHDAAGLPDQPHRLPGHRRPAPLRRPVRLSRGRHRPRPARGQLRASAACWPRSPPCSRAAPATPSGRRSSAP